MYINQYTIDECIEEYGLTYIIYDRLKGNYLEDQPIFKSVDEAINYIKENEGIK